MWYFTELVAGIALLIGGGDFLVRGASSLARRLNVKTLVVGLTVVAFGTSAPELAVTLHAVLAGSGEVSFGNIIGSNAANVGLILGFACLLRPIHIRPSIVNREVPMMLVATCAVFVMAHDQWLGSAVEPARSDLSVAIWNGIDRADGILLLLLFGIFCYYMVNEVVQQWDTDAYLTSLPVEKPSEELLTLPWSLIYLIGGLAALIIGGRMTVNGAVGIAEILEVPSEVIAFTIVAIGTSLPELAASLMAIRRGHPDLIVGNVVGSNLFNLLLVLSATAVVGPIGVPGGGFNDLWVMGGLSLILFPLVVSGQNRISRWEGGFLLIIYLAYLAWRTTRAFGG